MAREKRQPRRVRVADGALYVDTAAAHEVRRRRSVRSLRVEIRPSARKHGIAEDDIRHAVRHARVVYPSAKGDEIPRSLHLGPDRSGNFLEVVTVERDGGSRLAVHAMLMRPKYRRMLQ